MATTETTETTETSTTFGSTVPTHTHTVPAGPKSYNYYGMLSYTDFIANRDAGTLDRYEISRSQH